jgi:hypothetical protein
VGLFDKFDASDEVLELLLDWSLIDKACDELLDAELSSLDEIFLF